MSHAGCWQFLSVAPSPLPCLLPITTHSLFGGRLAFSFSLQFQSFCWYYDDSRHMITHPATLTKHYMQWNSYLIHDTIPCSGQQSQLSKHTLQRPRHETIAGCPGPPLYTRLNGFVDHTEKCTHVIGKTSITHTRGRPASTFCPNSPHYQDQSTANRVEIGFPGKFRRTKGEKDNWSGENGKTMGRKNCRIS